MKNFDNYYHLIVRGCQQQRVFAKDKDCRFYLRLLMKHKQRLQIQIYGFCLMPDYVSLLVRCHAAGELMLFSQRVHQSYALYFKDRYKSACPLRRRFKSIVLQESEIYECLKCMELFPVRCHLAESLSKYPWSSFRQRVLGKTNGVLDSLI